MTTQDHPTPRPSVRVVGVDARGEQVAAFPLGHGADPVRVLRDLGWVAEGVRGIDTVADPEHELTLRYAVRPAAAHDEPLADLVVPTDPGLERDEGEDVHPYQRAAAYALVSNTRGVLVTHQWGWTKPARRRKRPGPVTRGSSATTGGGIDPGESPLEALHREVWEESGQDIDDVRVLDIHTQHWIGRAPSGRLEDFHAVRIVFTATCPAPTDPVVHDIGGSTAAVRWVDPADIGRYRLTRSFAPHVEGWLRD